MRRSFLSVAAFLALCMGSAAPSWAQAGSTYVPTAAGANAAIKPTTADAIQYVAPGGSDSNDGLSWGTAKQTLAAAIAVFDPPSPTIGGGASANCVPGRIDVAGGELDFSSTIFIPSGPSCSLTISGISQQYGTTLKWTGASGQPMIVAMGANNFHIANVHIVLNGASTGIQFAENTDISGTVTQPITSTGSQTVTVSSVGYMAAGYWLAVGSGASFEIVNVTAVGSGTITANFSKTHATGAAFGGFSSNGLYVDRDEFDLGPNATADGLQLGQDVSNANACGQASYLVVTHSLFNGTVNSAIHALCGANTKDIWVKDSSANGPQYGLELSTNGEVVLDGGNWSTTSAVVADGVGGGPGNLVVENTEDEPTSATSELVDGDTVEAKGTLVVSGNAWEASSAVTSPVIQWYGTVFITGNTFGDQGASVQIWLNGQNTSRGASIGNVYAMASPTYPYAPIYDFNGGVLLTQPGGSQYGKFASLGDEYLDSSGNRLLLQNVQAVYSMDFAGSTSGQTTLQAAAAASGTVTLPALSGTIALSGKNGTSAGTLTLSGGVGSYTFGTAYGATPVCLFFDATTSTNAVSATVTASSISLTGTGTDAIKWTCVPAAN